MLQQEARLAAAPAIGAVGPVSFACPALCMKIQGNPKAQVDVKFGCESLVPQ